MSMTITRALVRRFSIVTQGSGNRFTVSHLLWMAKEVQEAVDLGLPQDAEVKMINDSGVNGLSMRVDHAIRTDIE